MSLPGSFVWPRAQQFTPEFQIPRKLDSFESPTKNLFWTSFSCVAEEFFGGGEGGGQRRLRRKNVGKSLYRRIGFRYHHRCFTIRLAGKPRCPLTSRQAPKIPRLPKYPRQKHVIPKQLCLALSSAAHSSFQKPRKLDQATKVLRQSPTNSLMWVAEEFLWEGERGGGSGPPPQTFLGGLPKQRPEIDTIFIRLQTSSPSSQIDRNSLIVRLPFAAACPKYRAFLKRRFLH